MKALSNVFRLPSRSRPKRYPDPTVNPGSSEFEVNNWIISEFILEQLIPVVGAHPFPLSELQLMVAAVCRLKPTHIYEWGTYIGKSARVFYETSQGFGLDLHIHSIDLPDEVAHPEHPGRQRGMLVHGLQNVHLHQGDGLQTMLDIAGRIGDGQRSLVFVDGDHRYDSVKRELAGIMAGIPRANILLHDTFFQSEESRYNVGPHHAISEVITMVPGRYRILSTATGLPGMTLLYQLP